MKKKYLFLLLYCFSVFCFAQNKLENTFNIQFKNVEPYFIDSLSYTIPVFKNVDMHFSPADQKIRVSSFFDTNAAIDLSSFEIIAAVYDNISSAEIGEIREDNIPSSQNFLFDMIKSRKEYKVLISAYPIIKEGNVLKRLKQVRFSYKPKNVSNLRSVSTIPSVTNSVLNSGDFFKFYIEKSGVYKLTKTQVQQIVGSNVTIDPRKIKIFGHGGAMLPLSNLNDVPFDLVENAIEVVGEEDGVFADQDYVLFYAQGLDTWDASQNTSVNLYDTKAYYYISVSGSNGKRITSNSPISASPTSIFNTYHQIDVYEKDLINVGRLGRKWLGENFNVMDSRDFTFTIPNLKLDEPIQLEVNGAANSTVSTNFNVRFNGNSVGTFGFFAISPTVHVGAYENMLRANVTSNSTNININLRYNNNGVPSSSGYLDYIKLKSVNTLKGYGKQFLFFNEAVSSLLGVGEYQFQNATGIAKVWDVTDLYNISAYVNASNSNFSFKANLGELRKYVAIDNSDLYSLPAQSFSRIQNQNLKGSIFNDENGQFKDIDYLIITSAPYLSEANRLALLHKNVSNYNVKVVDLNQIYQEFSSGQRDIAAIRNFIRYVYFNASTPDKAVKYVNLFGDTSYDYKNVVPNNVNVVPTFHFLALSTPSSGGDSSNYSNYITFMSDDFYGLMDDHEGTLNINAIQGIDIAVGRMIFTNITEARQMVDKVYKYYDKSTLGRWKNSVVLLSDDIDNTSDLFLQSDLDAIAQQIEFNRPFVNVKKIYMDAYQQTTSAGGSRYLDAKQDFLSSFDSGSLLINYYGHGGERVLSSERIFELLDVDNLKNNNKLPVFVTITCEVSRFDNPYLRSLGEAIYLNPNAGAIGLITTTREIGISSGRDINARLSNIIFNNTNEDVSIGEALRLTKNSFSLRDRNVVFCIGDPALKILFPKPKIVLTKVNGQDINGSEDVLQALSYITLQGEIQDSNNNFANDFNGDLAVQIFDKNIDRVTLGNDYVENMGVVHTMNFQTLGETIFRGNASVVNGRFEFGFVVPKDIKIPVGNGKVSFYAKNESQTIDKTGYNTSIRIGGFNNNAPTDDNPPTVRLYMNDTSFVSGGVTNNSPIFLAFLQDDNGINTASGIGHDIIAILDGDEMNPYILNDFYETELNDYKNGKVRFPFSNLSPGLHTITFKAWDVYNNPVVSEIQFFVTDGDNINLTNVLNYPNPFVNYTEFWFTHNRPFELLKVQVQILTISGKVVKTINESVLTEGFLSRSIKWDGRDDFGDKIAKGVYIYKLKVQSTTTNKSAEKIEKLVIL